MLSDSVSGPHSENLSVSVNTLRTNPKFSGSFPFLPKSFKYHNYIIINYSGSIRELKFLKHVFLENLSKKFSETLWKDLESFEVPRNYQNINILYITTHIDIV